MRRNAVPLHKTRHEALVQACLDSAERTKATAVLLGLGTGARNDTIGHTHVDWFHYDRSGNLYYKIPRFDDCRKEVEKGDICGHCRQAGHGGYTPKTPAGEGREILISDQWTNPVTGERDDFGLRSLVEDYFALDSDRAPDGAEFGHQMFQTRQGPGIDENTLNRWLRDIGAEADILAEERERRLRNSLTIDGDRDTEQIVDFGTDEDGNSIPDLMVHDLRASFCTQLMRNDVSRSKAITKTGHKVPESMNPYIDFAAGEIAATEEDNMY